MANRLANSTSPYLQQHAENPVDWWEWGPEAFAEAERRDTPILVSVGYAACHWCHVMAHDLPIEPLRQRAGVCPGQRAPRVRWVPNRPRPTALSAGSEMRVWNAGAHARSEVRPQRDCEWLPRNCPALTGRSGAARLRGRTSGAGVCLTCKQVGEQALKLGPARRSPGCGLR